MLSHTFWTLSCHSDITGAQFCNLFQEFPEFSRWLQLLPVSWQYLAVAGVYRDGIDHVLFYTCLIDHFLVSIFVALLDTTRLRMVHHIFEME